MAFVIGSASQTIDAAKIRRALIKATTYGNEVKTWQHPTPIHILDGCC